MTTQLCTRNDGRGRHKVCYRSPAKAKQSLIAMRNKGLQRRGQGSFYKCKRCGGWHITHFKAQE